MHHGVTLCDRAILTHLEAGPTFASLHRTPLRHYLIGMLEVELKMPKELVVSIVDDDPSVSEGLMDLLSSMGFVAETFRRADEFLQSGRVDSTSCLIADVQMPGMSGIELHDQLVKSGKTVPTILITAFPKEADRARVTRTGVRCYLSKPFSEQELLICIRSALGSDGLAS
jgi:FixJ family two-component response regulator